MDLRNETDAMSYSPEGFSSRAFSAADFAQHEQTYRHFLALAKWSATGVTALLVLMAIFLI